jgi:O-antigen/teichoic acid export membrane protein
MAILAGVLLIHQPIYVLTQFLIARALQRPIALVSIGTTVANLGLSFVLAWTVGIWGVALSTLVTDLGALAWVVPRLAAPAARARSGEMVRSITQPVLAVTPAAFAVLVVFARWWHPHSLTSLAVVGIVWSVAAAASLWRFGLAPAERSALRRHGLGRAGAAQAGGM